MNYLSLEELILIHDEVIANGLGLSGIKDFNLLIASLEKPRITFGGHDLYEDEVKKAASLLEAIIRNHPFADGNKRTAFFSTLRFLRENNYSMKFDNSEIVKLTVGVATKKKSFRQITNFIKSHLLINNPDRHLRQKRQHAKIL